MKIVTVDALTEDGDTYGQVSSPDNLKKAQSFAHDRLSLAVKDFVIDANAAEVKGFAFVLTGDMGFRVNRPGRIYAADGVTYDQLVDFAGLEIAAADEDFTRIDLVVAKLEDEVPETDLIPHVRVVDGARVGDPVNKSVVVESHWRVVVQVKTGTPSASPNPPTLGSNEVELYRVTVPPGATVLTTGNFQDVRRQLASLRQLSNQNEATRADVETLLRRIVVNEDIADTVIDLSPMLANNRTLAEILADLIRGTRSSRAIPEIKYDNPKYALTDKRVSQLAASGVYTGGNKYIQIETGVRVNFGDSEVTLQPSKFADQTVNPVFVQASGGSAHEQQTLATTLPTVSVGASDASVSFAAKTATLTPARQNAAAAARDTRYIEIFGGNRDGDASYLTDWKTYDAQNDTMASRTITGDAFPLNMPAVMFPMGNGTHVLVGFGDGGNAGGTGARWFKVNASTGVSTEITGTKPTGLHFIGDLISANKIFLVSSGVNGLVTHWEYDVAANTFSALTVSGGSALSGWTGFNSVARGCYYADGQFLLLINQANDPNTSYLQTFIFDRPTLQWTQITSANAPYARFGQGWMLMFDVANVNGRPVVVNGTGATFGSLAPIPYELITTVNPSSGVTSYHWAERSPIATPNLYGHNIVSTIGGGGRATGKGFIFGGNMTGLGTIYGAAASGLIATTYSGADGITIGNGSTYAQFEMPLYVADWAVAGYLLNLRGENLNSSTVKAEVSFDNGTHWHEVTPGRSLAITDSQTPGNRRLRITLYRSSTAPPIITGFTEALDQTGAVEAESRMVLRFNAPAGTKALYIDYLGNITISSTIEPSTEDKAILLKMTEQAGTTPHTVKNYINRRRPRIHYEGTGSASTSAQITVVNELAVPVRWIAFYNFSNPGTGLPPASRGLTWETPPTLVNDGFDQTFVFDVGPTAADQVYTSHGWILELEG
jgi:hypothetical protein